MPIRGGQIASSDVGSRDGQLELREVGRFGERRCRLERRDRPGVVAEAGAQGADRRVQPDHVGMPERQGRRVVADGIAVGEEPGGPVTGLPERLRRLGVPPGIPLVLGDLDEPAEIVATGAAEVHPQRVRDASVQESAASQAGGLVDEVAQRAMGEVVSDLGVARAGDLPDEGAVHQLVHRLDDLVLGSAAGVSDGREVERTPDRGGGGEDLLGGAADRGKPLPENGPHAIGHAVVGDGSPRECLDDVERQAFRRRDQRIDHGRGG